MQQKQQAGFSLIELMMVVSIVGILSAMCFSGYQNYAKRARFAEVISATEPFKNAVSLALQSNIPIDELNNGKHGIPLSPDPTKNLSSIQVNSGTITSTATALANKDTYIMTPKSDGSAWAIDGSCVNDGFCES